jgi:hypothetical protein
MSDLCEKVNRFWRDNIYNSSEFCSNIAVSTFCRLTETSDISDDISYVFFFAW